MQEELKIIEKEIDSIKKELLFSAKGKILHKIANNKLRIICVFSNGEYERRFPIDAFCVTEESVTYYRVQKRISLQDVFYQFYPDKSNRVKMSFEYCDADGKWHVLPGEIFFDANLFEKTERKSSFIYRLYRKIAYIICTLLLPIWLLDGFFAMKGYKKSVYVDDDMKGKKGIIYHAHGIVKSITGYGYSPREVKTSYFVRKYQKACKKSVIPEGILFLSERKMESGGNLDVIRREIATQNKDWAEFIDSRPIDKLPFSRIREAAKLAAGVKVIVLEDFYPQIHALTLRPETKLVQLWHACGAFKMFGLSDIGKVKHLEQSTKNHRSYSAALVSGKQMVPFYSEAFGIAKNHVFPLGVPRTDVFFDDAYKQQIRRKLYDKYPQLEGKKVILFAPTFRGSGNKDAYYPRERFDVNSFMANLPEDTMLLIKNHPFVKDKFSYDIKYRNSILDMTGVENINDLLFITSVLITDYSSSVFEAALLQIPMLFYVFDLEEYIRTRDFYFDFSSFAPGNMVRTQEELEKETNALMTKENDNADRLEEFCEYFMDGIDGNCTKKIIKLLYELKKTTNS